MLSKVQVLVHNERFLGELEVVSGQVFLKNYIVEFKLVLVNE
jgi:hypothetical protein